MSVKLYAMTCGWLTGKMATFITGGEGEICVPVPSYLIDHPKGQILFDSGLHEEVQTNPVGRLGFLTKVFKAEFSPGEELRGRLELLDVDISKIRYLINSHLHFDHAGGNEQVRNAQLLLQRPEWMAAHEPDQMAANGYQLHDYDHGHDLNLIDGEHDVFGDGSVLCVPTYGHTPGHQSLKVRLDGGDILLTGDACYLKQTLEDLRLPKVVSDREEMLRSLEKIRYLQKAGARIFYGHDPDFWSRVPQAPAEVKFF